MAGSGKRMVEWGKMEIGEKGGERGEGRGGVRREEKRKTKRREERRRREDVKGRDGQWEGGSKEGEREE